ncbi:MAG TPA: hypothetical protein PLS10_14275 [Chitinophagales bacterium]|nr:hypothetical protein [Chitinophagales bacterium]
MMKNIQVMIVMLSISTAFLFAGKPTAFKLPTTFPKDSIALVNLPKEFTHFSVRDFTMSPNKDEIFFTVESNKNTIATIIQLKKINGQWHMDIAPFSGNYYDLEATFAPDGKTLYFVSNRPLQKDSAIKDFDIWKTEKVNGIWQAPKNLGTIINTAADEFYPSVTNNGTIYFTAQYINSKGKEDIWMSKLENGNYTSPVSVSDSVNSVKYEFNAYVAPDESIIIFTSFGREDDLGGGDLYISKKDAYGNWTKAKNLGSKINSGSLDYCPFISFDKQFFVFTSNRSKLQKSYKNKLSLNSFLREIGQLQNGKGNLYWINALEVFK